MLELWEMGAEMEDSTTIAERRRIVRLGFGGCWRWSMEALAVYELAALHSRGRMPTLSEMVWSCRARRQARRVAELSVAGVLGWAAWHLLIEGLE